MDGEKSNIPLGAGLDCQSSDMMVSLANPKFAHRWQREQGRAMPSSLRFEKNGWASNWNVYGIRYSRGRVLSGGWWFSLSRLNGNPAYVLAAHASEDAARPAASFVLVRDWKVLSGDAALAGGVLSGRVGDKPYSLAWDEGAKEFSLRSGANVEFTASLLPDYTWLVSVEDGDSRVSVDVTVLAGGPLTGDLTRAQEYLGLSGGRHTWQGGLSYDVAAGRLELDGKVVAHSASANRLSFSLAETVGATLLLRRTNVTYLDALDNMRARSLTDGSLLTGLAAEDTAANRIGVEVSAARLAAGSGVELAFAMPVWESFSFTLRLPRYSSLASGSTMSCEGSPYRGERVAPGYTWEWSWSRDGTWGSGDGKAYVNLRLAAPEDQGAFGWFHMQIHVRYSESTGMEWYTLGWEAPCTVWGSWNRITEPWVSMTDSRGSGYTDFTVRGAVCVPARMRYRLGYKAVTEEGRLSRDSFTWEPLGRPAGAGGLWPADDVMRVTMGEASAREKMILMTLEQPGEKSLLLYGVEGMAQLPPSVGGGMQAADEEIGFKLAFDPYEYIGIQGMEVGLSVPGAGKFGHVLHTSTDEASALFSVEVGEASRESGRQEVTLSCGGASATLAADVRTGALTLASARTFSLDGFGAELKVLPFTSAADDIEAVAEAAVSYPGMECAFAMAEGTAELVSATQERAELRQGGRAFQVSLLLGRVLGGAENATVSDVGGGWRVMFEDSVRTVATLLLPGVWEGSKSGNVATVSVGGKECAVDLSRFDGAEGFAEVLSTDIRRPHRTYCIGRLDADNEFQLVRQQWNSTVEVESFWWVDERHVLELTGSEIVLKARTDELDDWNGDRWVETYRIPRSGRIAVDEHDIIVTGVWYESRGAVMLLLSKQDDMTIRCRALDPLLRCGQVFSFTMAITRRAIGEKLVQSPVSGGGFRLCTYKPLTADGVMSGARWSATLRDNRVFLGCHLDNNFCQWTMVYNLGGGCESCVQGYGLVGLDATLTGGEIPARWFDPGSGFSGTVQDVETLGLYDPTDTERSDRVSDVSELHEFKERVVGTAAQQWYVSRELHGIVSHLKYASSGRFRAEAIPLTNNYDLQYKSPSFSSNVFADLFPQAYSFRDLFTFENAALNATWTALMVAAGWPQIAGFFPRYSVFSYLQQTVGEYAYVHVNANANSRLARRLSRPDDREMFANEGVPEFKTVEEAHDEEMGRGVDPMLNTALTFDRKVVEQETDSVYTTGANLLRAIFFMLVPHTESGGAALKDRLNEAANTTTASVVSTAYDTLSESLADAMTGQLRGEGLDFTRKVSVVALKSLDMFYSTSDRQNVRAGAGFVEHSFVAGCVAQSEAVYDVKGHVTQVHWVVKAMSMWSVWLANLATRALMDLINGAEVFRVGAATASANPAGIAMVVAAKIAQALNVAQEAAERALDNICDALGGTLSAHTTHTYDDKSYFVERKHKYGSKNEVFMYPCWGVPSGGLSYPDERVEGCVEETKWRLGQLATKYYTKKEFDYSGVNVVVGTGKPMGSSWQWSGRRSWDSPDYGHYGDLPYYQAQCMGRVTDRRLPEDMACILGVERLLPTSMFRNRNMDKPNPAFAPSVQQDYIIDRSWGLSQSGSYGLCQWISVKDTKVLDGEPSNMVVTGSFCGVASSYAAIEVKRGLSKAYMRPWAITPTTLALNCTGLNCVHDDRLRHAFDGTSYRIVEWRGSVGLQRQDQTFLYSFQVNDRLKTGNKPYPLEAQGHFEGEPVQAVDSFDRLWVEVTDRAERRGLGAGTAGEDRDSVRWSLPVFTEPVSTLPAVVRTLGAVPLLVVDGVTSLCTSLMNTQGGYKVPVSVDFSIGKKTYRLTEEYICEFDVERGIELVSDIIPTLGLTFLGSSPHEAYLYSKATRCYYVFNGSSLLKMDMVERFRDVQRGYWDFVNQEVVMPCLMTFRRLNPDVSDRDTETDNIIVPVLSGGHFSGELPPPTVALFNDRSWYRAVSLPSGFAYQGPNRVSINRGVFVEYMADSVRSNLGKWRRLDRERYGTARGYPESYSSVDVDVDGVDGWTHNPFLLVTSPLGLSEDEDCLFEWEVTFCWTVEMDMIYNTDDYACVNIMAETMAPGGKLRSRPTHVFLTKELFTRTGSYGYYSFRYQSKNGSGNRERLHIWCDQYIAVSALSCTAKLVSARRTEQLTQQLDVTKLHEL